MWGCRITPAQPHKRHPAPGSSSALGLSKVNDAGRDPIPQMSDHMCDRLLRYCSS